MKRLFLVGLLALGFCALAADSLLAQQTKTGQLSRLFRDVVGKPGQSTVRVLAGGKEAALGTIVSADGWIVSKYSELKDHTLTCRMADGTELDAEMTGFDVSFDLALLKVDAVRPDSGAVERQQGGCVGHWVASVGAGKDPVAVGVISVATVRRQGREVCRADGNAGGYLGVALDFDFAGVRVQDVLPDTAAAKSGFKVDDQILALNGQRVHDTDDFLALMSKSKSGETITLRIKRADIQRDMKVTLGERPGTKGGKLRGEIQNSMGSKLSDRRAGFPVILQHDSVLKPADCGGPLVNLDGEVLGINICRAGRTENYAIPSEVVQPLLEKLKKQSK